LRCKKEKLTFPDGQSFTPFRVFPFGNMYILLMDWNISRFTCQNF
jgi:hypothetical protein